MDQNGRTALITQLEEELSTPEGKQAMRLFISAFGSVPVIGGVISGTSALHAEREQNEVNKIIIDWARLQDAEIQKIAVELKKLQAEPTREAFVLLIKEIFGEERASTFLSQPNTHIPVVLNSSTRDDLEPYVANGWISINSTGSQCSMGTGCRVGDHIEELKRPYGMGSGFVLTFLN